MHHLLKPNVICHAVLAPIIVIGPVVLPQSARMFNLLVSISRANIPMFENQMRPKTVDTYVGLEPLTKDVEEARFPTSCCWWNRDQIPPIKSHSIEITCQPCVKGGM